MRLLAVSLILIFLFSRPVFAQGTNSNILNCNSSISFSIDGVMCSLGYIIDQFTEFTPNILSNNGYGGSLAGIAFNQYTQGTEYIAFAIIPILIYLYILNFLGEVSLGKTGLSPQDLMYSIFMSVLILILSPYILSMLITFINVLDKFIIIHIIHSSNPSLFQTIINSMNLSNFNSGIFSGIINYILYILLIIVLFLFSFQFILRFILLWILILFFPFGVALSIYPPFGNILGSILSKIMQLLFIQPAFLIGISIFILIVNNFSINVVEKFIISIVTLFSLALIPNLLTRYLNFSFSFGQRNIRSILKYGYKR